MLLDECRLVTGRVNRRLATEATLLQMAVSGVLSKKANGAFRNTIQNLTEG